MNPHLIPQHPKLEAPAGWIRGRFCRNCSGPIPKPKSNKAGANHKKIFCCDTCRKDFHRNNGISTHRLEGRVRRWVRDELENFLSEQRSVLSEKFSRLPAAPVTRNALMELVNGK